MNLRIEKFLDKLVSKEQAAFVKGRLLQDSTNNIAQTIKYAEKKKCMAHIFSVDFKKAFDTLEHKYLWTVMERMGFGSKFMHMVKTLYQRAESSVINGG